MAKFHVKTILQRILLAKERKKVYNNIE